MFQLEMAAGLLQVAAGLISAAQAEANATADIDPVAQFIAEKCHLIPGNKVTLTEFRKRYSAWAPEHRLGRTTLARRLRQYVPVGASTGNKTYLGNVSFNLDATAAAPYTVVDAGKLRQSCPVKAPETKPRRKRQAADMGIRFQGRNYSVAVNGHKLGLFPTREAARQARNAYLASA